MSLLYTDQPDGIYRRRTASLEHYDAEYLARARALWADPRIAGRYYVLSGSRSGLHQAALYRGWKLRLPGFNPANPPGQSRHEWTDQRGAEAMDIHPVEGKGGTFAELHAVAKEYGFHFPIPAEKWHAELDPKRGFIPPLTKEQAMTIAVSPVGSATRDQGGGWVWGSGGHVYAFDGAQHLGNWDEKTRADSSRKCVALVVTKSGAGYWLVSNRGEVYAYGDAAHPGNYLAKWGSGEIIGAFRNDRQEGGGLTLVRDDGKNQNLYRLPA